MSEIDKQKYLDYDGMICPSCDSNDIEGGSIQVDSDSAWQDIRCIHCDSTWTDVYLLSGIENFERGS